MNDTNINYYERNKRINGKRKPYVFHFCRRGLKRLIARPSRTHCRQKGRMANATPPQPSPAARHSKPKRGHRPF